MRFYPALAVQHGGVLGVHGDPTRAGGEEMGVGGQARRWAAAGAAWTHMVDVDAARGGRTQWQHVQHALGRRLRVQFGGGVRSMTQVQQLLDLGVEHVLLGTQAVRNPLWLREVCRIFPGRIVLALDARGRNVLVEGRTQSTGLDVVAFARELADAGLAAIAYTAVAQESGLAALDRELVRELRAAVKGRLIVEGAVDAADLEWLEGEGVDGLVAGDPFYGGAIDLAEAIRRHPDRSPAPPVRRRAVAAARPAEPGDGEDDNAYGEDDGEGLDAAGDGDADPGRPGEDGTPEDAASAMRRGQDVGTDGLGRDPAGRRRGWRAA